MQDLIDFLNKYNIQFTVENDTVVGDIVNLSYNKLQSLPESIGNLKCNKLYLNNNKLKSLPESFGNLKCNKLYLNNNKLKSLPESFGNLKCNQLDLDINKLQSLPESIGNLKCNTLYLHSNKLQSLPESIGNLKCNTLFLNNNKLQSLPESFGNLKCNYLYLHSNKLQSLPESFGNLKCNKLYLHYNNLQSLPESIGNLKCNELYLYNNNLQSLPESFGNLKCNQLFLGKNNLQNIPVHRDFDEIEVTDEYIYCDEILTWYESKRKVNDYDVYVGYLNNYVVSKGDAFAHGDSIRQCIADIQFKLSDRDTSKYKGISNIEPIELNDMIVMYRTITGACSGGVESFLNSKDSIKDTYSINEVIDITQNQFGHNKFKEFFN